MLLLIRFCWRLIRAAPALVRWPPFFAISLCSRFCTLASRFSRIGRLMRVQFSVLDAIANALLLVFFAADFTSFTPRMAGSTTPGPAPKWLRFGRGGTREHKSPDCQG